MLDVEKSLSVAVRHFWKTRASQKKRQGVQSGAKDTGDRGAVTGGKHADGFIHLISEIVRDAGLPEGGIRTKDKSARTLPGYFRPTKEWDLVVLSGSDLIAIVEIKTQVGSFGNNFNNRVEEALGSATDIWKAYSKGAFTPSGCPWLGYLFMLEDAPGSNRPTKRIALAPFEVDPDFQELSYARRYEEVCRRLVRERMYNAACFIASNAKDGAHGVYREPCAELGVRNFAVSLHAQVSAFARMTKKSGRK